MMASGCGRKKSFWFSLRICRWSSNQAIYCAERYSPADGGGSSTDSGFGLNLNAPDMYLTFFFLLHKVKKGLKWVFSLELAVVVVVVVVVENGSSCGSCYSKVVSVSVSFWRLRDFRALVKQCWFLNHGRLSFNIGIYIIMIVKFLLVCYLFIISLVSLSKWLDE